MIPQHSSPPERPRCVVNPVCSQTRLECMYLHHKVPKLYEYRCRNYGSMDSGHMASSRSKVAFSRILYPPSDSVRIPGSSPPTTGWRDSTDIPLRSSGSQSIYSCPTSRRKEPPDKGKYTYSLVDPPAPPQSFNLIQSNRKNRPFSNHPRGRF